MMLATASVLTAAIGMATALSIIPTAAATTVAMTAAILVVTRRTVTRDSKTVTGVGQDYFATLSLFAPKSISAASSSHCSAMMR